ncbi:hypothetical protein DM01DRAFT_1338888 [Hesseltinella vesiculosa]|uniref:Uncharacterized protein n=1 Tax=Hesseltinella vesiculosa TaxID=101127 RepID=A0A1X2GA35_9FUNG|nr:hypothetical protein DM01DRAFT_1338888 [Hesseltinella vesiculosa]
MSQPVTDLELSDHNDNGPALEALATRIFCMTCYKFTLQTDPYYRRRPLYSFLNNWFLHTMYNKSQKFLLDMADITPHVHLANDNFMYTPPPPASAIHQLQFENEDDDHDPNDLSHVSPSIERQFLSREAIQEGAWLANDKSWEDSDTVPDLANDPRFLLGMEEDDEDLHGSEDDQHQYGHRPPPPDKAVREDALMTWYRATVTASGGHSSAAALSPQQQQTCPSTDLSLLQKKTAPFLSTRSWHQHLRSGIWFCSQRLIESAYLVVELAESMMLGPSVSSPSSLQLVHASLPMPGFVSRICSFVLRICRVVFLGVEVFLHTRLDKCKPISPSTSSPYPLAY